MKLSGDLYYTDEEGRLHVLSMVVHPDRIVFDMDSVTEYGIWNIKGTAHKMADNNFYSNGSKPIQSGVEGPEVKLKFVIIPAEHENEFDVNGTWHDSDSNTRFSGFLETDF